MKRIVLNRVLGAIVQILLVTFLAWLLFFVVARFTGATPARRLAGKLASPARVAQVAKIYGLNLPYWEQYFVYLNHLLHGNFGFSYVQQRPVLDIVWPALRATASLVLGAALLWLSVSAVIGTFIGRRLHSVWDVVIRFLAVIGMSVPVFWLSPMLAYLFGFEPTQGKLFGFSILGKGTTIFPIGGYVPLGTNPAQWAYHLVLPWICLATAYAAVYIRYFRTLTAEQLSEDYVRTATAKGASSARVLTRHVGRNVSPTISVVLGADLASALTGVFFVETVFAIPGLGYVGVSAVQNLDYPVITAVVIVTAVVAVILNMVVDLLHAVLDPRVRRVVAV
jgi:peptide/nickel transport system permease protein